MIWCLGNTQNTAVYVRKIMHTPLKWFGKRLGVSLRLGFFGQPKFLCTLKQWDLKHGSILYRPCHNYHKDIYGVAAGTKWAVF